MKKYFILPFLVLFFLQANAQVDRFETNAQGIRGKYQVVFLDGTSKIVKGKIAYVVQGDSVEKDVLIYGEHTITPDQTQSVTRLGDLEPLEGLTSEDKRFWLFKTIKGKISAYAALPNGRGLQLLEKDGVRVPFTIENILPLLKDDSSLYRRYERSLKVFIRQKRHPVARVVEASLLTSLVIGLSVYSLYVPSPAATLLDITVIGATAVLIIVRATRLYPLEAIRQYNYVP